MQATLRQSARAKASGERLSVEFNFMGWILEVIRNKEGVGKMPGAACSRMSSTRQDILTRTFEGVMRQDHVELLWVHRALDLGLPSPFGYPN